MSRDIPRRPASSRNPTVRPRRIAGRGSNPASTARGADPDTEEMEVEVQAPLEPVEPVTPPAPAESAESAESSEPVGTEGEDVEEQPHDEGVGSLFSSRRTTSVLLALVVVFALIAGGLGIWLQQHDDAPTAAPTSSDPNAIAVPEGRPVLVSPDAAQEAVEAAAQAAETIVATSYEDYDKQVDEAAALMTEEFAKEYRQTAADVRQRILDSKTEVQVRIVAQGVVRANTSEVQALLFLNQYSSKNGGETTYTPYRALVTVVHADTGWLVSGLDTQ